MLQLLKAKFISAEQLKSVSESNEHGIFVVELNASHMVEKDGSFDK